MSADPIIYCLEHLTDYLQFERLCSDIVNESGYEGVEPIGGSNDRGRDALHMSRSGRTVTTIFAYSVRGDWEQKLLNEDCQRIKDEKHQLQKLVFVTTAGITASQRDKAIRSVSDRFGWSLEIFDIERIRVSLATNLRHLIAQHPAIFCEPFFPRRGGLSIAESRDTVVVDHLASDHALATWLARRLQLLGYRTWCYGTAPLAGETSDDTIRTLMQSRAVRYLPILSRLSIDNADLIGRCSASLTTDGFLIPCYAEKLDNASLPSKVRQIVGARFHDGWATGLSDVTEALSGVPRELSNDQGVAVALRSYVPEPVTKVSPESIYANVFNVRCPALLLAIDLANELTEDEEQNLRKRWAFVKAGQRLLLSFEDPPDDLPRADSKRLVKYKWKRTPHRFSKRSTDVVKELVRRSMDIACVDAGLQWCEHRQLFYFPSLDKPLRSVSYTHVDGRNTHVAVTGMQSYGSGDRAIPFRYQLSPGFRVGFDENQVCWLTLRVYVRVTTEDGTPYEGKAIGRRRKKIGSSWWNKEWFARLLGVVQALSSDGKKIVVGNERQRVVVDCRPLTWLCPVSIDYRAVERAGDFQQEISQLRYIDNEDDEDSPDE